MNIEECEYAIKCDPLCSPIFGDIYHDHPYIDIYIEDNCSRPNNCWMCNNGAGGYKCHPQYKSSLYVNTAEHNQRNYFSVLDYEVFILE